MMMMVPGGLPQAVVVETQDLEEEDIVVDVGGRGMPFAYRPDTVMVSRYVHESMSVLRETRRPRRSRHVGVYRGMKWEDSPMKTSTYKLQPLSEDDLSKTMDDVCCFCLDEFTHTDAVTSECGHSFCVTCFKKYKKEKTCPCCRQHVGHMTKYCLETPGVKTRSMKK